MVLESYCLKRGSIETLSVGLAPLHIYHDTVNRPSYVLRLIDSEYR